MLLMSYPEVSAGMDQESVNDLASGSLSLVLSNPTASREIPYGGEWTGGRFRVIREDDI